MSVYIVVSTKESEIEHCEAYAGANAAMGRAVQLAFDKAGKGHNDLVDTSPKEELLTDCSTRWVFMSTNKQSVQVIFRKIEVALPAQNSSASAMPPVPIVSATPLPFGMVAIAVPADPMTIGELIKQKLSQIQSPPIHVAGLNPPPPAARPPYDFQDRSLPVGWKSDGRPAVMGDLLDNPLDVQDPSNLTDAQKWALVTARVSKSPGWKGIPKGSPIAWFSRDALTQLKSKSAIGELLRDGEIESLHHLRDDLVAGTV